MHDKNDENEPPSKMELLEQSIDVPQTATNLLNSLVLNGGDHNEDQKRKYFLLKVQLLTTRKQEKWLDTKK